MLDKHKGLSSGPNTHANSQMYVPVGSRDKGGLLGFARQPKHTMVSSGLSERLSRGNKAWSNRGADQHPPLATIHIGMGVCSCTYICANTTQGEKKNHKSKSSSEKAYRSESGRTLGMVIRCFCSAEPGSVTSLHPQH